MTGNITEGTNFKNLIKYLLKADKKSEILSSRNIDTDSKDSIIQSFNFQRKFLNPHLKKPVLHISLNFSNDDNILDSEIPNYINKYTKEMHLLNPKCDLRNAQYIAIKHNDTDNKHVHIVFNKVTDKLNKFGKSVSIDTSNIRKNNKKATQKIAKENNLHLANITVKTLHPELYKRGNKNKYETTLKGKMKVKYLDTFKYAYLNKVSMSEFFKYIEKNSDIDVKLNPKNNIEYKSPEKLFKGEYISPLFSQENILSKYKTKKADLINIVHEIHKDNPNNKLIPRKIKSIINKSKDFNKFQQNLLLEIDSVNIKKEKDKVTEISINNKNLKTLNSNYTINILKNYYLNKAKLETLKFESYLNIKNSISKLIKEGLEKSSSINELATIIKEKDIIINIKKSNIGNIVGISFSTKNQFSFSGSLLNYKFSAKNILKTFENKTKKSQNLINPKRDKKI